MDFERIPSPLRRQIDGLPCMVNDTGMSGSQVLVFPDAVLKIGPHSQLTDGMLRVLSWLEGRLPAPRVLGFEQDAETEYLLMTRVADGHCRLPAEPLFGRGTGPCPVQSGTRAGGLLPVRAGDLRPRWV